jgi:hypothetical protein
MTTPKIPTTRKLTLAALQMGFLTALPRIEAHGRVYFRSVRCASTKEECLAEMTAISWKWWVHLHKQGKDPSGFIATLATFAARAVKSGRRLCGMEKAKDVMSPRAQQRHQFAVGKLPDISTLSTNPLVEALTDNTQTPPDQQVMFRLDFRSWLGTLDDRRRRIVGDMLLSERTLDLARKYGISPARISQLRRELQFDWEVFCSDTLDSEEEPCPR